MAIISQPTLWDVIFSNENVRISIKISLKFVPEGLINNIPALVQVMAWCWPGDKPLYEPMITEAYMHHLAFMSQRHLCFPLNTNLNHSKKELFCEVLLHSGSPLSSMSVIKYHAYSPMHGSHSAVKSWLNQTFIFLSLKSHYSIQLFQFILLSEIYLLWITQLQVRQSSFASLWLSCRLFHSLLAQP